MSTVLHYMQRWLPLSEQFVHSLVTRSRHKAVVVSREPLENGRVFPHRPVLSLSPLVRRHDPPTTLERKLITASLAALAVGSRAKIIHHHHGYRLADVSGVVRRLKVPLVVSVHGHDVTSFASDWRNYVEESLALADAVIVPSRFLAGTVAGLGVAPERIHAIASGVDTGFFEPTPLPDAPEVLFVGRFVEKKGIDVLLQAWPAVREKVPEARLRLLGFGPLESLARAGTPGVEVEPTDPSRRAAQVRDALRRSRVVVTPSRTASDGDVETLLLVNLEAQAAGRPLVTTRHGGIPEFVDDGRSALLVAENDADALAEALVAVLTDDALARRLAGAGPAWAKRFDWVAQARAVDDLYERFMR